MKIQRIKTIKNRVLWGYLIIIFGIFPLVYRQSYIGMGQIKFDFFWTCTLAFVEIFMILILIQTITEGIQKKIKFSGLDWFVSAYGIIVLLSYLLNPFKEENLLGAGGWWMGFLPQMFFVILYFSISRCLEFKKILIHILLVSSGIVYLLGILHRFRIDPLNIYHMVTERKIRMYLSTIGQATWYSSFLCVVYPIGLYLFFQAKDKKTKLFAGIYTALASMTLVTQDSDSAFFALLGMMILLFYMAFESKEKMLHFIETVILILVAFKCIGVLQILFKDIVVQLNSLSIWMSQGWVTTVALLVAFVVYIIIRKQKDLEKPLPRKYFWLLLSIFILGIAAMIIFIVLNSTGVLESWFGYTNSNNYLMFNDRWGNKRGFSWAFAVESYRDMPLLNKLIGIGPDGFKAYHYNNPESAAILNDFWNGLTLTNAHNEYLNLLLNLGMAGVTAFLGIIVSGINTFVKRERENVIIPAIALCIISYACHNFFCYQQVCCTPFLFILLGIGENLIRKQNAENVEQTE